MTILPLPSRHTARVGVMPMVSSKSMPARLRMPMSCGCVPSPTPRLASSSSLRSNTTASQPVERNRCATISPPSEPPMTSARRCSCAPVIPGRAQRARPEVAGLMASPAASPESISRNGTFQRVVGDADMMMIMDSGLAARRRPGMTITAAPRTCCRGRACSPCWSPTDCG